MGMNMITIQGVIPKSDKLKSFEMYNEKDEARAVLSLLVSVRRNFKPADEKYYPEDLFSCKVFGKQALHVKKFFKPGDPICLSGSLYRSDSYTDDNGVQKQGNWYLHVSEVSFIDGIRSTQENGEPEKQPAAKVATAPPVSKPVGGGILAGRSTILAAKQR